MPFLDGHWKSVDCCVRWLQVAAGLMLFGLQDFSERALMSSMIKLVYRKDKRPLHVHQYT